MKKIPGWYPDPEQEGMERYWNGDHWESNTRAPGAEVPEPFMATEKYIGRLLFRIPLNRDRFFITFAIVNSLILISAFNTELEFSYQPVVLIFALVAVALVISFVVYVLFVPFLYIRRKRDLNNGLSRDVPANKDLSRQRKFFRTSMILMLGLPLVISFSSRDSIDSRVTNFADASAEINDVVRKYYVEVTPLVSVIQGISNGTKSSDQALLEVAKVNLRVPPILRQLRVACEVIPEIENSSTSVEEALNQAWNALKVTCQVTPLQYATALRLYKAQVDDFSTQADLDVISSELQEYGEMKREAGIEAINALRPYVTGDDLETLEKFLELYQE